MASSPFETSSQTLRLNVCAMEGVGRATARCIERLGELNCQALRVAFEEHSAIAAHARSPAEVTSLQFGLLGVALQKAMSYWQHVGSIAAETCSEIALDCVHCLSDSSPRGREFVDSLLSGSFLRRF
ncbi:phasin family protein [Paraburkholderia terrae]